MDRLTTILASVWIALSASARNDWYDTPLALTPGTMVLDTIPAMPDGAMVHLRLSGAGKHAANWSLIWEDSKTSDCIIATVSMPERRTHDDLYPAIVYVDVVQRAGGVDNAITSANFSIQDEFFSLKFIYDGFSGRLFAGDKEKKLLSELPIDPSRPTIVKIDSRSDLEARRISVMYNVGNTPSRNDCPDEEELTKLMADAEGIEGTWMYLDRDIDTGKASLGHKYSLVIVKSSDSAYQIISVDPKAAKQGLLMPLQVKGWLRPTNFSNNYDLVWYDANGRELNDDNNAQLSDDGAILTLRFPVFKSQLRFTRP